MVSSAERWQTWDLLFQSLNLNLLENSVKLPSSVTAVLGFKLPIVYSPNGKSELGHLNEIMKWRSLYVFALICNIKINLIGIDIALKTNNEKKKIFFVFLW